MAAEERNTPHPDTRNDDRKMSPNARHGIAGHTGEHDASRQRRGGPQGDARNDAQRGLQNDL
jgi:hypothetical protein